MVEWISPALVGIGVALNYLRDVRKRGAESQQLRDLKDADERQDKRAEGLEHRISDVSARVHERIDTVQAEVSEVRAEVAGIKSRCEALTRARAC